MEFNPYLAWPMGVVMGAVVMAFVIYFFPSVCSKISELRDRFKGGE